MIKNDCTFLRKSSSSYYVNEQTSNLCGLYSNQILYNVPLENTRINDKLVKILNHNVKAISRYLDSLLETFI